MTPTGLSFPQLLIQYDQGGYCTLRGQPGHLPRPASPASPHPASVVVSLYQHQRGTGRIKTSAGRIAATSLRWPRQSQLVSLISLPSTMFSVPFSLQACGKVTHVTLKKKNESREWEGMHAPGACIAAQTKQDALVTCMPRTGTSV